MNVSRRTIRRSRVGHSSRRGSVLVVVLALLAALMLLGFLFLTLASQERENARYFTASEKWYAAEVDPDSLFNFALEQIILGPQDDLPNSALWGGRYGLLASLVGDDIQPYSGSGVNVIDTTGTGTPAVDQRTNGAIGHSLPDGVPDPMNAPGYLNDRNNNGVDDQLELNVPSLVIPATPSGLVRLANTPGLPPFYDRPDVGYTYPDINSPFLAYIGKEPLTDTTVVIPSFHRPQYLRGLFNNPPASPTVPPADWYTDPRTETFVLRPHATRTIKYFDYETGGIIDTGLERFTDATVYNPGLEEGIWTWDGATDGSGRPNVNLEMDVDADKDGTKEAVIVDLDYPIEETPDGSQKFVPLFGITLYDLDGLLNLNAHGNLYNLPNPLNVTQLPTGPPTAANPFVHLTRSNEGRSRHEINPAHAFDAPPASATDAAYNDFFSRTPTTATELANMEFWFILAGRAKFDGSGSIEQLYPGRWGEAERLENALSNGIVNAYQYPLPGQAGSDEYLGVLADANRGGRYQDRTGQLFPPSVVFPRPVHPEDWQGQGSVVAINNASATPLDGKTPHLVQLIQGGLSSRVYVQGYLNYWLPPGDAPIPFDDATFRGPLWQLAQGLFGFTPTIVTQANVGLRTASGFIYPANLAGYLIDDPGETLLDPENARDQVTDSIFGANETAFLHLDQNTVDGNGIVSRLLSLVPANFKDDASAEERRKRFTTVSSDPKAYSLSVDRMRRWEVGIASGYGADRQRVFPPYFRSGGVFHDPFRPEARGLLQQTQFQLPNGQPLGVADRNNVQSLVRKLSVNHVAAALPAASPNASPRYLLRPLTPHPTGLSADALPTPQVRDLQGNVQAPGTARPYFGFSDLWLQNSGLATSQIASPPAAFVDGSGNPYPAAMQEWHARRDRQNMARDIYTLLYMLGDANANPTVNPVTTSNAPDASGVRPVYSDEQLIEMAQFAVNLVDAMDPDDTVTCFVFDTDLSDGYTLNDDGYTNPIPPSDPDPMVDSDGDGDPTNDLEATNIDVAGGRGIVYGVESQKLTFAEALAVFARRYTQGSGGPRDHDATEWDDSAHRDFVYVELQNMTPWTIPMNGSWSVVCEPNVGPKADPMDANGIPIVRSLTIVDPGKTVQPGATFTIGTAGDDRSLGASGDPLPEPSWMNVDPNLGATGGAATYTRIAPAAGDLSAGFDGMKAAENLYRVNAFDATRPWGDGEKYDVDEFGQPKPAGVWLDLGPEDPSADEDDEPRWLVANSNDANGNPAQVTFRLRRRLNLNRLPPTQETSDAHSAIQRDNPWIEVDSITVPLRIFNLTDTTDAASVQAELEQDIVSSKRRQPLDRQDLITGQGQRAIGQYQQNNLGGYHPDDLTTAVADVLVQAHYDRSFASLADVLNVPLYGPNDLTRRLPSFDGTAGTEIAAVDNKHQIAGKRVLFPELPGVYDPPVTGDAAKNLWYRILDFVEVPSKYGDTDGWDWFIHYAGPSPRGPNSQENLRLRDFGKLNLNTMRHPQVLAGLLDDPRVFGVAANAFGAVTLPAVNGESRDWWISMLQSRDGIDGYYAQPPFNQSLILPGVPSANPFKSFSTLSTWTNTAVPPPGFNQTLLRSMPGDTDRGRRSLFELGNAVAAPAAGTVGSDAEFATRYRLLGKVLNHGTTRSNTYVCFLTCDFYEATGLDHDGDPNTPDVYQIGAKLEADSANPDEPRYRGVFIIDRSKALEMLEKRDLPPTDTAWVYPQGSRYRTYSFAREAGPDGRPAPTFDWKELVLYRKVTKAD